MNITKIIAPGSTIIGKVIEEDISPEVYIGIEM
jgi:hypothetical protein